MHRLKYKLLSLFRPELAHRIGVWAMENRLCAPGPCTLAGRWEPFGVNLLNPVGLAAGFDKTGRLVDTATFYGFGWIEVGSVTYLGGEGNPRPRMFRLPDGELLNRMGLNGPPAEEVALRLKFCQQAKPGARFAVNVAKTHDPSIMGDAAIADILATYKQVCTYGIYTALNISCPNTVEGKTFEDPDALRELLSAVKSAAPKGRRPLVVKLSPEAAAGGIDLLDRIVEVCVEYGVAGFIASNTLPFEHEHYGRGGVSGHAVRDRSLTTIRYLRKLLPDVLLIGCGGVYAGEHLDEYLRAGADLVQAYCGFVRGPNAGPDFVQRVVSQYKEIIA